MGVRPNNKKIKQRSENELPNHRIIDDRIEKYDAYVSISQSRIAAMKNVLADGRCTDTKGGWSVSAPGLVQQSDCVGVESMGGRGWYRPGAQFVFLLFSFLFCHL